MNKTCSHCQKNLDVSFFHRHPSASLGVKHVCKPCSKKYNRELYLKRIEKLGKKPFNFLGTISFEKRHKQGDVRDDGMIFHSSRKLPNGTYREWWMPKNLFEIRIKAQRERARFRYKNDAAFRKKQDEKNKSDKSKERKRIWNKRNRHVLSEWQAARRAKIRGDNRSLSSKEKGLVREFYKFRDILNEIHGKTMFHVDHRKALARGGSHHPSNIQLTTAEYNVKKFVNDKPRHAAIDGIRFVDPKRVMVSTRAKGY